MSSTPRFFPGDPIPWFVGVTSGNPDYQIQSTAGRFIVLCFLGSGTDPAAQSSLASVDRNRRLFDDHKLAFFGISIDPKDQAQNQLVDQIPGIRFFWDFDRSLSARFGACDPAAPSEPFDGHWLILDPTLRVIARFPLDQAEPVMHYIAQLPSADAHAGVALSAPVLTVPRVFEPAFCRSLVEAFLAEGGSPSGVTKERDGKTVVVQDQGFKRRSDVDLPDERLRDGARTRIQRRLVPEIAKAFQFQATRMERYIVSCYDASSGGFFRAHRDNTTKGTAHRRFAVTINLNAEEYEGGNLRFPEFGSRIYHAPTGGAVVFSCSLMHEAMPVTKGRRYAFLPFLYDEAAAKIREANSRYLDDNIGGYRAGLLTERK